MPRYIDADKVIEGIFELTKHGSEDYLAALVDAEAVVRNTPTEAIIEKQMPKKVIVAYNKSNRPIEFWCPNCERSVLGSGFYCWHCGQQLDWDE